MSNYRRLYVPGGNFFFTVVTHRRQPIFSDDYAVQVLRESFLYAQKRKPFNILAAVIMPDHLHCIWTLPNDDADYSTRWQLLKTHATRKLKRRPLWQNRFWEHAIRDENDLHRHLDYIHFNPVKHGYVSKPADWPWSSFRRFVERGYYPVDWGQMQPESTRGLVLE